MSRRLASGSQQPSSLSVRDLTVSFPASSRHRPVLSNVSVDVHDASVVALIGPSGSGKSVFAHAILGLLPSHAEVTGSIYWLAADLCAMSEKRLRSVRGSEIALVPQDQRGSLNPRLSIRRHFAILLRYRLGIRDHREIISRATRALVDVGLDGAILAHLPDALSGGMCQRVSIALALALEPRLLIADEPTSSLDIEAANGIVELLARLRDEHKLSLLFISHDLRLVQTISDRVVVLVDGAVVESDVTEHVFRSPAHAYTRIALRGLSK